MPRWDSEAPAALVTPSLLLCALFTGYLRYHDYPLGSTAALTAYAMLFAAGMVPGALAAFSGPGMGRALLFLVLPLLWLDLQSEPARKFAFLHDVTAALPAWATAPLTFVLVLVPLLLVLSLRRHIAAIAFAVCGVLLLGALVLPVRSIHFGEVPLPAGSAAGQAIETVAEPVPGMLHLVLDAHLGPGGIPTDIDGGAALKERLLAFYQRWGFRLYERAYSPFYITVNAMGNLLNGELGDTDLNNVRVGGERGHDFSLSLNRYFEQVREGGREIDVVQSDFLDYCATDTAPVERCYTYPASSLRALADASLPALAKASLLLETYLKRSSTFLLGRDAIRSASGKGTAPVRKIRFFSLNAPEVLQRTERRLLARPAGTLHFSHVLLPHWPYVWNADCTFETDTDEWRSRRPKSEDSGLVDVDYRAPAYKAYFGQVHCLLNQLDGMFSRLDEAGVLDSLTVVVHGDHGTKINLVRPFIDDLDSMSDTDFVDSFSTLFAIRTPSAEPGVDPARVSLHELFSRWLLSGSVRSDDATLRVGRQATFDKTSALKSVPMVDF